MPEPRIEPLSDSKVTLAFQGHGHGYLPAPWFEQIANLVHLIAELESIPGQRAILTVYVTVESTDAE